MPVACAWSATSAHRLLSRRVLLGILERGNLLRHPQALVNVASEESSGARPFHRQARPWRYMAADTQATQLWIDCDAGTDDAQGILLALANKSLSVSGISATFGNTNVAQVSQNIARVLTLAGRQDIPLYIGADKALTAAAVDASFYHGSDGLGDVPDEPPNSSDIKVNPREGSAPEQLVNAANQAGGRLTIAALGPLTNLAHACKMDPELPSKVQRLVVMGGAEARGNITPCAEFNFYSDPEAAQMVLSSFPECHIVTWECALRNVVPWHSVDEWLAVKTPAGKFMAACTANGFQYDKNHPWEGHSPGYPACDPLAVAVALYPHLVQKSEAVYCEVELQGKLTRGQAVFDWRGVWKKQPNVKLVQALDVPAFHQLMLRSLG